MLRFLFLILLLFATSAQAATYHIDPTVGTSGTGTAVSPFKHWSNLPSMSTGDDVYFKCGTTMTATSMMSITWSGTESNRSIIGAYWMDGATAKYEQNGERPIISGNNYTVPTWGSYSGLINVSKQDYITIENLEINKSGGFGIQFAGDATTGENSAYFIARNVFVNHAGRGGIYSNKNPYNYGLIEDCEVAYATYIRYLDKAVQNSQIYSTNSPYANITIRNNYVHHCWGEGIGSTRVSTGAAYDNSGYATIEGNIVMATYSACIYVDGTVHDTLRNNIVFGLSSAALGGLWYTGGFANSTSDGRDWQATALGISTEDRLAGEECASYISVYNNLIVGAKYGIYLTQEISGTSTDILVYNNTLIGNRYNLRVQSVLSDAGKNLVGWKYKNNVHFSPSDTISENILGDASFIDSKIDMDYNSWTGSKPTYAGGTNDAVITATDSGFEKTSGWQALTGPIDAANFQLKSTSTLIDEGVDLGAVFTTDYFAETRGASWDIGADEYIPPGGLPSNTVTAHYMSSAPTIDGTLTEWASIDGFTITDATTGKSGTYKVAFDGTYLYLSGSVADTTLNSTRETRDTDIWKDDSFELLLGSAIATDDNKAATDHKLTMNIGGYTNDAVGAGTTAWNTSWTPTISQAFVNTGTLNDANADTGYAFEARISWTDLGVSAPSDGDQWQFDFNQNDRDDDVRTYNWFWNSDGGDVNNPLGWGRLLFDIPGGGGSGSGIISLYDFESSALTTDSVGTNTLTNNATITSSADARRGSGSADLEATSSQYFSRTDADLSSGFPGKSGETNKDFTVGAWVKAESLGDAQTIMSKYNGAATNRTWHLSIRDDGGTKKAMLGLGYNSGGTEELKIHASALSAGSWYFIAATYADATKAYSLRVRNSQCQEVGSDLDSTATLDANGLSITDADFKIGAIGATVQFFDGLIDYAFVYNEALSESEINALCGTTRRSRPGAILLGW